MKNDISKYPDLVKYRRKGIIIPIVFTAIYELLFVALIVALFICNMFMYNTVFYLILAVVAIIPLFVFKPVNFLFDKTFSGKVISVNYNESLNKSSQIPVSYVTGIGDIQDHRDNEHMDCWQTISIETEDGIKVEYDAKPKIEKTHQDEGIPMASFGVKKYVVSSLIDYYKIGDEVEHYSGFAFNKKLNLKPNDKNICIVCGTLNSQKENTCKNCGHSIVK